jgi:hypothetical protein
MNVNRFKAGALQACQYLLRFLQLQLFLTLVSWPLLLYWGLPLSLASIVGNFIFTPFLVVFLLLSSLLFLCELCFIPHTLLIYALEHVSNFWYNILLYADRSWLIYAPEPSCIAVILVLVSGFYILHHKKFSHPFISCTLFTCVLTLFYAYLYSIHPQPGTEHITCFNNALTLITSNCHKTILIDPGYLARRISAPDYVQFTLVPQLSKKGIRSLESVIIFKPSRTTFKALATLCSHYPIKTMYMPAWSGQLSNTGWKAWQELRTAAVRYNTTLITLDSANCAVLPLSAHEYIALNAQNNNKIIRKNKLIYPELSLTREKYTL